MIARTKNERVVISIMAPYLPLHGFDPKEFVLNDDNVCLLKESDLSLFEKISDEVYEGHYFFQSRGKKALRTSQEMLSYFVDEFKPRIIKGLTPLENLGARWMSRQLGFKSYGVVQTVAGPCELFIMTEQDWSKYE